jgi:hypothetical protein
MRRTLAIGIALLLLGAVLLAPGAASGAGYWGPGFKICRALRTHGEKLYVSAQNLPCGKAIRLTKAYWFSPPGQTELVGESEYNGYVRLKRFPGWRCNSGAGGAGGCHKGRQFAAFNYFEP